MPRKKLIEEFIDDIPDAKLEGLPTKPQTLYGETNKQSQNFRLDMQGVNLLLELAVTFAD